MHPKFWVCFLFLQFSVSFAQQPSAHSEEVAEFQQFKKNYKKNYKLHDDSKALKEFSKRMKKIKRHNEYFRSGKEKFEQGPNEYSDLSEEGFNEILNSFVVVPFRGKSLPDLALMNITIPTSLNYTALGFTSNVKNQGICGSCWTFSTTGMLEGQFFKKTGNLTRISEQNLIDCNKDFTFGNYGCSGGNMLLAYEYVKTNLGISRSSAYTYKGSDAFPCSYNPSFSIGTLQNYELLPPGNETLLLQILVAVGPLSIAMDSSLLSFQNYKCGIYEDPACTNVLNHAMLLVGFGTDVSLSPPVDFWIVKNSYGLTWGERGYFRVRRGVNMCGIADYASYALV